MGRKNMAMFEQAISMITPFRQGGDDEKPDENAAAPPSRPDPAAETIDAMKSQLEAMQKQLNSLAAKKGD